MVTHNFSLPLSSPVSSRLLLHLLSLVPFPLFLRALFLSPSPSPSPSFSLSLSRTCSLPASRPLSFAPSLPSFLALSLSIPLSIHLALSFSGGVRPRMESQRPRYLCGYGTKASVYVKTSAYHVVLIATHCNTLQHTAALCNTLQHTATHCNM